MSGPISDPVKPRSPRVCINCGDEYVPDLEKTDPNFSFNYPQWLAGKHSEKIWPESTALQRAQIGIGLCSTTCMEQFYDDQEEDDESEDQDDNT